MVPGLSYFGKLIINDLYSIYEKKWYIRFYTIANEGIGKYLPAHLAIYDKENNIHYEGGFIDKGKDLGDLFHFRQTYRENSDHIFEYPIPINGNALRKLIGKKDIYAPNFNCQTNVIEIIKGQGCFLLFLPIFIYLCGSLSLSIWAYFKIKENVPRLATNEVEQDNNTISLNCTHEWDENLSFWHKDKEWIKCKKCSSGTPRCYVGTEVESFKDNAPFTNNIGDYINLHEISYKPMHTWEYKFTEQVKCNNCDAQITLHNLSSQKYFNGICKQTLFTTNYHDFTIPRKCTTCHKVSDTNDTTLCNEIPWTQKVENVTPLLSTPIEEHPDLLCEHQFQYEVDPLPVLQCHKCGELDEEGTVTYRQKLNSNKYHSTELCNDLQCNLTKESLIQECAILTHLAVNDGINEEKALHYAFNALHKKLLSIVNIQDKEKAIERLEKRALNIRGPNKLQTLKELLLNFLKPLNKIEIFHDIIKWIEQVFKNLKEFLRPLLELLMVILEFLHETLAFMVDSLVIIVNEILAYCLPKRKGHRIKTVWALAGIAKQPALLSAVKLAHEVALNKYVPRTTFELDYDKFLNRLKSIGTHDNNKIGGAQYREIRVPKNPVMAEQEAAILGITDATIDQQFSTHVKSYLNKQTVLGADATWLAKQNTQYIIDSLDRYNHSEYATPLTEEEILFAKSIAVSMTEEYPNALLDCKLTRPEAIANYIKYKYSPGSPFIGHYRTRQEMFNAGWDISLIKNAYKHLLEGTYPIQFYHAFPKSQVVDIKKIYEGKNVRTVVSQDLASYFVDQVVQFERNKRITWATTGIGSGMPLNNNMEPIFKMARQYKTKLACDAKEADSRLTTFSFEILAQLAKLGYANHPNGKQIASVLENKYKAMQNAYIFAITNDPTKYQPGAKSNKYYNVRFKNNGGGTGQSATTWDNTMAIKGVIMASWIRYNQKRNITVTPKDFFKHNFFNNTSDDNIWCLDQEIDVKDLADCAKEFNMILTIEDKSKEPDLLKYLGKTSRTPTASDLTDINILAEHLIKLSKPPIPPPELSIVQDTQDILMRRTGNRYYQQSPFGIAFKMAPIFILDNQDLHFNENSIINVNDKLTDKQRSIIKQNNDSTHTSTKVNNIYHKIIKQIPKDNPIIVSHQNQIPYGTHRKIVKIQPSNTPYNQNHIYEYEGDVLLINDFNDLPSIVPKYTQISKGAPLTRFKQVLIDKTIGHAMLTAFKPSLYNLFFSEYLDYTYSYLPEKLHQFITINNDYNKRKIVFEKIPPSLTLTNIEREQWKWITNHKYPRYVDILKIHLTPGGKPPDYAEKLLLKLERSKFPTDIIAREIMTLGHRYISELPRKLYRFQPSIDMLYPEELFTTRNCYIEKFIYMSHFGDTERESNFIYQFNCLHFIFKDQITSINEVKELVKFNERGYYFDLKEYSKKYAHGLSRQQIIDIIKINENDAISKAAKTAIQEYKLYLDDLILIAPRSLFIEVEDPRIKIGEDGRWLQSFSAFLKESPYGNVCDTITFWQHMHDTEYLSSVIKHPKYVYQNMTILATLIYGLLYYIESIIYMTPVLGTIYAFIMFMLIDIPKVYAITNILYWLANCRSSAKISSLIPRDPYIHSKRFSMWVVDQLPIELGYLLRFDLFVGIIPELLEQIAIFIIAGQSLKPGSDYGQSNIENEWNKYTNKIFDTLINQYHHKRVFINARTGSGKSTWFIDALCKLMTFREINGYKRKILLVVPRLILRDNWTLKHTSEWKYQVLKEGIKQDPNNDIYVLTYGHLLTLNENNLINQEDLILFDEFHELLGEMIAAEAEIKNPVILLSATPKPIASIRDKPTFDIPIKGANKKITEYTLDMNVIDLFQEAALRHPEEAKRTLIIVPLLDDTTKVRAGIQQVFGSKYTTSELSSRNRIEDQESNVIVATQIVDAGMDLKNPPTLLIDSGLEICIDKGQFVYPIPPTRKSTKIQRMGRTGRVKDGIVYSPSWAGTGQEITQYPVPSLFARTAVAQFYEVPKLNKTPTYFTSKFPYFDVESEILGKKITKNERLGLAFVFLMNISGVPRDKIERYYNRFFHRKEKLHNDLAWARRILEHETPDSYLHLPGFHYLNTLIKAKPFILNLEGLGISYFSYPHVINGKWVDENPLNPQSGKDMTIHADIEYYEKTIKSLLEERDRHNRCKCGNHKLFDDIKCISCRKSHFKDIKSKTNDYIKSSIYFSSFGKKPNTKLIRTPVYNSKNQFQFLNVNETGQSCTHCGNEKSHKHLNLQKECNKPSFSKVQWTFNKDQNLF